LLHASINHLVFALDEKYHRQFAGLLASKFGHDGIEYLSKITGPNRNAIICGKQEIKRANEMLDGRVHDPEGGRFSHA